MIRCRTDWRSSEQVLSAPQLVEMSSTRLADGAPCSSTWGRGGGEREARVFTVVTLTRRASLEPGVSPAHIGHARAVTGLRPGRPRHGHCFLINLSLSLSLSLSLTVVTDVRNLSHALRSSGRSKAGERREHTDRSETRSTTHAVTSTPHPHTPMHTHQHSSLYVYYASYFHPGLAPGPPLVESVRLLLRKETWR